MLTKFKSYQSLLALIAISAAIYSSALIAHASAQLPGVAPAITALTVSKTDVTGGFALSGVVTLDRAAPVGGLNVSLSTTAAEVKAPANVTIFAGRTAATFAINTGPVDQDTAVVVTASTQSGSQRVARFTLLAPRAKSLSLSSSSIVGGQPVRATVELTGPTTARGLRLQLTSSNAATATVPASIFMGAGKQSGGFDVTTTRVTAETPVTISIDSPEQIAATLTVTLPLVPELVSLTLSPSAIPTNEARLDLVFDRTLTASHTVQFTSSNSTVLPVPPQVNFQSGISSIPVFVTPTQVTSDTSVTITAVSGNSTKTVTTTVRPLVLQTFSASVTEIIGGARPVITVALNLPRNVDTPISLTANSGLVSLPNSIVIPARTNQSNPATVTFELITLTATTQTLATITASMPAALGGGSKSLAITILPVAVASVSLQTQRCDLARDCPAAIAGTVTLNGAAPLEGVTIAIASDRTQSATVSPSSVLISQGQTSAFFSVSIPQNASLGNAQISARVGSGSARNSTLELVRTFMGVESMTLSSNTTQGGTPVTGTVNVRQYVVSGNGPQVQTTVTPTQFQTIVTVNISGNGPQQQLSLNVPSGQSSGTFTYTPPPTAATETRTLTAHANPQFMGDGVGRVVPLTVNPATFNSFSLSENNVQGGRQVTGTVQMSAPVPFSDSVIRRLCVATMLAVNIAVTQSLHISLGSAASAPNVPTKPSAAYVADDVEGVVQAAKDGISRLNASNSAGVQSVSSALENFATAVSGLNNQAGDLAALTAEIKAVNQKIEAIRATIDALRSQMESVHERFAELDAKVEALEQCNAIKRVVAEHYAKLIQQLQSKIAEAEAKNQSTASLKQELSILQNRRDEELKKLAASCDKVLSEVERLKEQVKDTAKARKVLDKLSVDRTKASQLVQLIRTNNRTGLSEFLRQEAGGGDFVISDAKIISGPLVVFRVDSISHCLSVGSQCSGKSYLLTR